MTQTPFTVRPATSMLVARRFAAVAVGVALLAASAKTQVPFWPVPMTLQLLAVWALAVAYGPSLAFTTFTAYLAAGALSLPVFAGATAGPAYLLGPTGGYLAGMLVASGVVGRLAYGRGLIDTALALLVGVAIVYACGALWLLRFLPPGEVPQKAVGLFAVVDLIKVAIVAFGATALALPLARLRAWLGLAL